jgi:hypothetical protein
MQGQENLLKKNKHFSTLLYDFPIFSMVFLCSPQIIHGSSWYALLVSPAMEPEPCRFSTPMPPWMEPGQLDSWTAGVAWYHNNDKPYIDL